MILNKIVELNLGSKAKELKEQNKGEVEIARILSECAGKTVTRSSVHRYFEALDRASNHLIEKKETLQAKVIEAEIDTISRRNKIFERLERIADKAEAEGIDKTVIEALKTQLAALDSLDKRLGKFAPEKKDVNLTGAAVVFYLPENKRDNQKEIEGV